MQYVSSNMKKLILLIAVTSFAVAAYAGEGCGKAKAASDDKAKAACTEKAKAACTENVKADCPLTDPNH
jgi:hypothetical protein